MLREHLAGGLTLAFAVLLVLLAVTPGAPSLPATAVLLLLAAGALAVWLLVESRAHLPRRGKPRTP